MKKMISVMAVLALVACDSATGSNQAAGGSRASAEAQPQAAGPSFSGGSSHRAAIASVRARVVSNPGLYTARALVVDGGEVTVEIRSSTGGFSSLSSGTFVSSNVGTGEVDEDFQTTPGVRYLVVAYPSVNGVVDATHASFVEALP